ncbi:conserved protein of unknown function (plasmid) [Rhodovastum atsumiense]|nr:conserved protein of unknown function [Rhodovastum atsumiense]
MPRIGARAVEPGDIDTVPAALRRIGWPHVAAEWERMQKVLALYASDESRYLCGQGEPYGSITTEAGIKARQHRAALLRREGSQNG